MTAIPTFVNMTHPVLTESRVTSAIVCPASAELTVNMVKPVSISRCNLNLTIVNTLEHLCLCSHHHMILEPSSCLGL